MTVGDFMELFYDTLDNPDKAHKVLDEFFLRQYRSGSLGEKDFRDLEARNFEMFSRYESLLC